jgi:hypothetical protein
MDRCVLVTRDGGKTWTGLRGERKPTGLFGYLMMVGATSTPSADGPDLLTVTLLHCSGGEEPSAVYFRKIRFNGTGWSMEPVRVMDVDSWHCAEHSMDVIRLANGRLWSAWWPTARVGGRKVTARYSDDDGGAWRDLGSNGVIGGRGRPLLLPYGDGVACFRLVGWQGFPVWSYTADGRWTEVTKIKGRSGCAIRDGVPLGTDSILLAISERKKGRLLHLAGGKWVEEQPPFGPLRLSLAGDRVVAFGLKDKRTIVMSVRSADGKWSQTRELVREDVDLMDLAAPRRAPKGFVPVIWAPRNHKWIKFLRVRL